MSAVRLVCSGCGWWTEDTAQHIFSCPNAALDADVDHVLRPAMSAFEARDASRNSFIRYRTRLYVYHRAIAQGVTDSAFVAHVEALNAAIYAVEGRRFEETPLLFSAPLGAWVKNETGNVSGSHKARHLMGILLNLIGTERDTSQLAIASCGNAALAAAVLASAAERPLDVYIPTDAKPSVVERLKKLGARGVVCERREGELGDPCVRRFREAVQREGALPFSCQGPNNGLTIEGGQTLGYELIDQLRRENKTLDHLFIQVGGGALATACMRAFEEAVAAGVLPQMPCIHTVQTLGAYPLLRAWEQLVRRVSLSLSSDDLRVRLEIAEQLRSRFGDAEVDAALKYAVTNRSEFMWPWEETPRSIAHGILDDETYDWFAVVEGMLRSGGIPIVVDEACLHEAHRLAHAHTNIPVSYTGVAGLAGLLAARSAGIIGDSESVAVLFTGETR